jgi:hypothetical protein
LTEPTLTLPLISKIEGTMPPQYPEAWLRMGSVISLMRPGSGAKMVGAPQLSLNAYGQD